MLEEYYEFLCNRLIRWMNNVEMIPGDRYVLSFEEHIQVQNFIEALKKLPTVKTIPIDERHRNVSALTINAPQSDIGLIVVSTENMTPDYLVSLRNRVGKQQGIWANTALLFISNQVLDSINSGAKDISRNGGPFNLKELRKNLHKEIDGSTRLSEKEQTVLKAMVQAYFKGEQVYTLMDFAEIYAVIEKGTIEKSDYTQLGYFSDKSILTYEDDDIKRRLADNQTDFEKIHLLQTLGNAKEELTKDFEGASLINSLASDDWADVDYGEIVTGRDKRKQSNQNRARYLAEKLKEVNPKYHIWDQPQKTTAAGLRNRQIIVFNPDKNSEVCVKLPFDNDLKRSNLNKTTQKSTNPHISVKQQRLEVTFSELLSSEVSFYKIVYTHAQRFVFNILVVPFDEQKFGTIRQAYTLGITNKQAKIQLSSDVSEFQLGSGDQLQEINAETINDLQDITITNDNAIVINKKRLSLNEDDDVQFTVSIQGVPIVFSFYDNEKKIVPQNSVIIENYRRTHAINGCYLNEQISFDDYAFSVYTLHKRYLNKEANMIQTDALNEYEITLSEPLRAAYKNLFKVLRSRRTLMSLVYWDDEIKQLVRNILRQVSIEIEQSEEKVEPSELVKNIAKIGEVRSTDELSYAPFNPMLLAYQLTVEEQVGNNELSNTIQKKLNPLHLVPFIKKNGSLNYRGYYSENAARWLIYSKVNQGKISETSQKIITERLKDFMIHFGYLFNSSKTQYQIRALNVRDEKALLQSVSKYLIWQIRKDIKEDEGKPVSEVLANVNPITVHIVNKNYQVNRSSISEFYKLNSKEQYEAFFQTPLDTIENVTEMQLLETIQNKINIFYGNNKQISFHITFYQFSSQLVIEPYSMQKLAVNYTLNGLLGGSEYTGKSNSVKTGFGTKGATIKSDSILQFTQRWNELLVATSKKYAVKLSGQCLTNNIEEINSDGFTTQFDNSEWVTLLNPEVKLDYFNKMSRDIYVIHYTDYTNSANYESITMTKQVDQYRQILADNLPETVEKKTPAFIKTIINSFNVINGEWLLRLVSHQNQVNTVKEKLSILATYKEMLGILNVPDIVWLPLSLEEILRVAGSFVGETREKSIFSAKSLNEQGVISDDLLFIGLWRDAGQLKITFVPTEVKVGKFKEAIFDKAVNQVEHTYDVLKQNIFEATDFRASFYLDFFIKLFYANAAKFYSNGNMDEATYLKLQAAKIEIAQGDLEIDNSITNEYHNKFIFTLKNKENHRLLRVTDNCAWVEVPENDAFSYSGVSIHEVINKIQRNEFGFDLTKLLSNICDNRNGKTLLNNSSAMNETSQYQSVEINNQAQTDEVKEDHDYEETQPQFNSKLAGDFEDSSIQSDLQQENNDFGLESIRTDSELEDDYRVEDNQFQSDSNRKQQTTEENQVQSTKSENGVVEDETYRPITNTDDDHEDTRFIREVSNNDSDNTLSKVMGYWKTLKSRGGGVNTGTAELSQTDDSPVIKSTNSTDSINRSVDEHASRDGENRNNPAQILKESVAESFEKATHHLERSAAENVSNTEQQADEDAITYQDITSNTDGDQVDEDIVMSQNSKKNELVIDTERESDKMPINSNVDDENDNLDEQMDEHVTDVPVNNSESNRILLGTVDGSTSKSYWEYGNPQLANRHMLITGKSGQGKTYFMQTLLLEFVKKHIDTLVIDYTDSYLPDQLDPILQEQAKAINQHIIKVNKLALNPFKFNDRNIGGIVLKESINDVVSRVAEVLDFVFDLGIQQKSRLKILMNDGLEKNPKYTFSILKQQILDADNMSLYGRIQALLDVDPFSYEDTEFSWSDYFGHSGQINIIQLTSFQASVKNAIIEFILWDLFNYSQFKVDQHLTYPVFLDEVQNLSFNRDSPIFKILTEGRKFGWSGIFATQSLNSIKGEVDAIYNASEQVHFLPPESQTKAISKILSSDSQKQKYFENELTSLHKGQCIINGPVPSEDGTLRNAASIINVDSLEQRVDK